MIFEATDVMPGKYSITIIQKLKSVREVVNRWCWQSPFSKLDNVRWPNRSLIVALNDLSFENQLELDFVQTGSLFTVRLNLPVGDFPFPGFQSVLKATGHLPKSNQTRDRSLVLFWNLTSAQNQVRI